MTEEEARQKWCPLTKQGCLGSDCACWVWDKEQAFVDGVLKDNVEIDTGHCGLIR